MKLGKKLKPVLLSTLAVGAIGIGDVTLASAQVAEDQEDSTRSLDTVVVTARKRAENLQETPIAITAISADALESLNKQDLFSVGSLAPNLNFSLGQSGGSSALQTFIRGVGELDYLLTTDPTAGLYIDGVYIARTAGANLDLAGVEQIEVLRGPQGTLFGKNSIAGAINVTMRQPGDAPGFSLDAGVGNHGARYFKAYAETPLVEDRLSANLSLVYRKRDGWQDRPVGGDGGEQDRIGYRASLFWTPSDTFTSYLAIDGVEQDQGPYANELIGVTSAAVLPFFYNNFPGVEPCCTENSDSFSNGTDPIAKDNVSSFGVNWTNTWDVTDNITLKSITALRSTEAEFGNDYDHSPAQYYSFGNDTEQDQFSQEFQILGNHLDGRLDWVIGLYHFEEDGSDFSDLLVAPELVTAGALFDINYESLTKQESTSQALFAHLNYALTEDLSFTLGARYTEEEKELDKSTVRAITGLPQFPPFTPTASDSCTDTGAAADASPFSCKDTWTNFSPKLGLDYKFNENTFGYASVSQGFRSGGFNGRATNVALVNDYEPETMTNYEVGLKSELFDGRVRLNTALFRSDYTDKQQQVNVVNPDTGNIFFTVNNAGEARLQGVEAELSWLPTSDLLLNASLGYLDAKYTTYFDEIYGDLSDQALPHAPEWSGSLNAQYTINLETRGQIVLQGDAVYKDSIYLDVENSDLLKADSFVTVNASARYVFPNERWQASVTVKNLTDNHELLSGFDGTGFFGFANANYTAPTQYMFALKYSMF